MLSRPIAIVTALCCATSAQAQRARDVAVVIDVRDSLRVPVSGVDVAIRSGLKTVLATGMTNANGLVTFRVQGTHENVEITARKVGYRALARYVPFGGGDTVRVSMSIARIAQQLDTVRVSADADLKRRKLTIDADAIAASSRYVGNALDVVLELRPDMAYGLGGRSVCPAARNIWVNGRRILFPRPNAIVRETRRVSRARAALQANSAVARTMTPHFQDLIAAMSVRVVDALARIQPEHIEGIEMRDCHDMRLGRVGGENAIFVTLKPGVHYDDDVGSVVTSAAAQDSLLSRIMRTPVRAPAAMVYSRAVGRLLGIFDFESGQPVGDAVVTDLTSGSRVLSSESGALWVGFAEGPVALLSIQKPGFATDTLRIDIGVADTVPVTVLLKRLP